MNAVRTFAIIAFLTCAVSGGPLHAQGASTQDTVVVVDFGVNNPKYKAESKRIPKSLRAILEDTGGVLLVGTDEAAELLMEDSKVLNVFETDSSYWNAVGRLAGANMVVHGLVRPQDDTTMFVDLFVSDLAAKHVHKTALLYNPKLEKDQRLNLALRRVVDDLILFGRNSEADLPKDTQQQPMAAAAADTTEVPTPITALPNDTDDHAPYRWLIGGAALVAAAVTIIALLADAVEPSDHNLPAPPSFP